MDLAPLYARIKATADARGYRVAQLGLVDGDPIQLLVPPLRGPGLRLLVAAGFHGDEPGGVLAALQALQALPPGSQVAFIPIVNPSGLRRGLREDAHGLDPNRGFSHGGEPGPEAAALLDHWDMIHHLARNGFVALHEDRDQGRFYTYTFERDPDATPFSDGLLAAARRFFELVPDGVVEGSRVRGGLVLNECGDSMEDRLFHDGVPHTACVELPGQLCAEVRALGGAALVEAALSCC